MSFSEAMVGFIALVFWCAIVSWFTLLPAVGFLYFCGVLR